jgi:glycosyltransferase involved in cell wall biosynthesis
LPLRTAQDNSPTEIYMLSTSAVSSVAKGRTGEQGVGVSTGLRVAVLLPCLNEAAAIGDVLAEFGKALPDADIYVIDNGSEDATAAIAEANGAQVIHEPKPGKGNAVRRAFAAVEADVYLLADGDGTYDASRAPQLIDKLLTQRLDMVVGMRSRASADAYPWGHVYGNRLFNAILKRFFGSTFEDVLSGYRVFSRRYVRSFPALSHGFEIETEMAVHAILLRMPTAEIATDYGNRIAGTRSKLSTFSDGIRILATIVRLFRLHRPLTFFSIIAGLIIGAATILFYPVFVTYLNTGLVPRFPTLIASLGLSVIGIIMLACGLILDAVTHTQLEVRRLLYLNAGHGRTGKW